MVIRCFVVDDNKVLSNASACAVSPLEAKLFSFVKRCSGRTFTFEILASLSVVISVLQFKQLNDSLGLTVLLSPHNGHEIEISGCTMLHYTKSSSLADGIVLL